MTLTKKIPFWLWWTIGLAAVASAAALAVWLAVGRGPMLPPGLAEKREQVAKLLEEASRIEDVDVKPLAALEAKRDFKGAAALMESALAANAEQERLNASLLTVSNELTRLALAVEPDEVGARAVEAFGVLAELAKAEQKFFADRRELYEVTRGYYADLAVRKKPPIPADLQTLVETVNADLEIAKGLHRDFAAATKAFDEALKARN